MGTIFGREPALIITGINTLIGLLVVFGLDISEAQTAAIIAFANAVMAIWIRSNVTPVMHEKQPAITE